MKRSTVWGDRHGGRFCLGAHEPVCEFDWRPFEHPLLSHRPDHDGDLIALAEWLEAAQCTHVAMEATGVYWRVLEGRFQLILANAAHIKGVPGRKSDVNDATWIADLLAHGLIRASFVPPQPIQELRDLTRTRKQLTREIVRHTQRIQAVLEEANVKLSSAITDILGASGRRI